MTQSLTGESIAVPMKLKLKRRRGPSTYILVYLIGVFTGLTMACLLGGAR